MKTKERNNRLIALFNDCKQHEKFEDVVVHKSGLEWELKDLKYDTSWDWLMPVVEKMYKIGYSTDINSGNRRIYIHRNDIGLMANLPDYEEEFRGNKSYAHDLTSVQCLHTAVVEFIKFYSQLETKGK